MERETEPDTGLEAGIDIERPTLEEAPTIADRWVDLAAEQRAHGSHLAAAANRERILDSIGQHIADGNLLVARSGGAIVGFVMFSIERRLYAVSTTRGIVRNLHVLPEHRGEGIGSALLAAAEADLAAAGAERVGLEALVGNADARRFYEANGYTPHRIEFEKPVGTDDSTRQ
jgi:ribosomal protein S18 acetylase RimI-like enzyme